jgi:tetratricopeptide (TPR) repeat protein
MDVAGVRHFASEAQRVAERLGRDDLAADAVGWMASADAADGDVLGAVETDRRALVKCSGTQSFWRARVPLTLYWAGLTAEALEQSSQAVESARESQDPAFLLYALQHYGLALSGAGRYDQALRAFDEARSFGKQCGALPLLARATCMSVAPLLSLGDLEAAKGRALEARELAHRVDFEPPLVSAGIDLLLIYARSQDPSGADGLFDEVARSVEKASGWHAWKWQLRLWQARAELAIARGDWKEGSVAAAHVVEQSRAHSRMKYEALGLATRARALACLGSRKAAGDAQAAISLARRLADPAVLLDCLTALLQIEPSEELYAKVQSLIRQIAATLSDDARRREFIAASSQKFASVSLWDRVI